MSKKIEIDMSLNLKWNNCFFCFESFFRCFVGEGSDQWRTCSDRYFPLSSSSNSNSHVLSNNSSNSTNKKKTSPISYTISNKRKGSNSSESYHQKPPIPGGLQNLEDIASARLWPVTYLYSSGPPNSTDLSNFVDCSKEICWTFDWIGTKRKLITEQMKNWKKKIIIIWSNS